MKLVKDNISVLNYIYPRSFKDSSQDEVADVYGIASCLDYLRLTYNEIICFPSIFKSLTLDYGSDVFGFSEIEPHFYTSDLDTLLSEKYQEEDIIFYDFLSTHTFSSYEWSESSISNLKNEDYACELLTYSAYLPINLESSFIFFFNNHHYNVRVLSAVTSELSFNFINDFKIPVYSYSAVKMQNLNFFSENLEDENFTENNSKMNFLNFKHEIDVECNFDNYNCFTLLLKNYQNVSITSRGITLKLYQMFNNY